MTVESFLKLGKLIIVYERYIQNATDTEQKKIL